MKMFQISFWQYVSWIRLTWCHICSCVEHPCGRWKQECQLTINELNLVFFPNVALCAWNNMLASMQYQVRCMLSDFSYASNCQSHNLDRTTRLRRTHRTMDQVLWLDLSLYFHSAILVTTSWYYFMPLVHHWFHSKSLLCRRCWYHPIQGRLPSVHVEHTH